jgi:hypothetical protein
VTVTTTVPGQDARLTFSGTAGQTVNVFDTNVTTYYAYLVLVKPDGTSQATIVIPNSSSMGTQTLATTGTYTLWVEHYSSYIGSETLQVTTP